MNTFRYLAMLTACGFLLTGCDGGSASGPTTPARSMRVPAQRAEWGADSGGQRIESKHYRLFTTSTRQSIRRYMPGFMEAAYDNYLTLTGLSDRPPAEPMPIYMLGSRREWAALTERVVRHHKDKYLSIEAGGYCYRGVCVFWDMGGTGSFSVAAHEGLHQFFHHRLSDPLPMWLEEGMCVSAEGFEISGETVRFTPWRNPARYAALQECIVNDHWAPLETLLPMDAGDVAGKGTKRAVSYYAQLWALVQFLRSRPAYRRGLERLLADAEAGRLHEAMNMPRRRYEALARTGRNYNRRASRPLFAAYVSEDLDRVDDEFRRYARRRVGLR